MKSSAADNSLVPGDDGLPARAVGRWVARKTHYVDGYAQLFAKGMRNKWPRRLYVELFARSGRSWNRDTGEYLDGSAIRALSAEFTDYVFVDVDPRATAALRERARRLGTAPTVIDGDCNVVADQVIHAIPPRALTLLFVDPSNWQVRIETIAKIAAARKADLLMTFMYGEMRQLAQHDPPALTAFFGSPDWKPCLTGRRGGLLDCLAGLYNRQLAASGYLASYTAREVVKNSRNVELYALLLFSRHPRGIDFWDKVRRGASETGQLPMGF